MARYKPQERHSLLLPVVLCEQIVPGSFAFALDHLVDRELDLRDMDAKFKNDEVGASAYDPRVMLKVVLLAYSHGMISSRAIERACARNVQFIAICGDSQPSHTHIAKFVSALGAQIKPLFAQVLMNALGCPEASHQRHNGGVTGIQTSICATTTTLASSGAGGHGRQREIGVYLQPR